MASSSQQTAEELFLADYSESLKGLKINDKNVINVLSMIAEDGKRKNLAKGIVTVIVDHIKTCPPSAKLPAMYTLDSIVKNIGDPYRELFGLHLHEAFAAAYTSGAEGIQQPLQKLFATWDSVFSGPVLQRVKNSIAEARSVANTATSSVPNGTPATAAVLPRSTSRSALRFSATVPVEISLPPQLQPQYPQPLPQVTSVPFAVAPAPLDIGAATSGPQPPGSASPQTFGLVNVSPLMQHVYANNHQFRPFQPAAQPPPPPQPRLSPIMYSAYAAPSPQINQPMYSGSLNLMQQYGLPNHAPGYPGSASGFGHPAMMQPPPPQPAMLPLPAPLIQQPAAVPASSVEFGRAASPANAFSAVSVPVDAAPAREHKRMRLVPDLSSAFIKVISSIGAGDVYCVHVWTPFWLLEDFRFTRRFGVCLTTEGLWCVHFLGLLCDILCTACLCLPVFWSAVVRPFVEHFWNAPDAWVLLSSVSLVPIRNICMQFCALCLATSAFRFHDMLITPAMPSHS